jgi:hypothetical protein
MASAGGQLRALNRLRAEALATLPLGIGIHGQPWPEVEPTRTASAGGQLRALNRLRAAEALGDLTIGIDASLSGEIDGPVQSVSDRRTAGALRSSRAHSESQGLPPAGATVPPWLIR